MDYKTVTMPAKRKIALIAHDNMKKTLPKWVDKHRDLLEQHELYATGTTGTLIASELRLDVTKLVAALHGW